MLKIKQDPKLLFINNDQALCVPLEKVIIRATIRSLTADIIITQVFRNNEKTLIETVYYFPIENQEIVYAFTAHIDGQQIVNQSKKNNNTFDQDYQTDILKQDSFLEACVNTDTNCIGEMYDNTPRQQVT
jgi:hypothetical protein